VKAATGKVSAVVGGDYSKSLSVLDGRVKSLITLAFLKRGH
jgi:hypothetical protein